MKKFLLSVFLFAVTASAFSQNISARDLTAVSTKFIGIRYSWGKSTPKSGFDCSGFIFYIFNYFHIAVPRTSLGFFSSGKTIHPDSCKTGDIIVFTGTNPKKHTPEHVGIVLSGKGNNIRFIHSSSSAKNPGVKISTFQESPSYKKRFIKIVRIAEVSP